MLRDSMGGEGVQVSEGFQLQHKQQQQQQHSSGMATAAGGAAYPPMHYSSSSNGSANTTLSPSSARGSSSDAVQRATTSAMAAEQQHYQNQLMSAAAVMNSSASVMAQQQQQQSTCLVCYNAHVDVLLEPCRHQFHAHCIHRWLTKDKVCPICWHPIQRQRRIVAAPYAAPQQQQSGIQSTSSAPQSHQQQQQQQSLARSGYAPNPAHAPAAAVSSTGASASSAGASADGAASTGTMAPAAPAPAEPLNPATTRKGKWTAEESLYCDRLIEEFKKGNLPLAEGTTLRTFLAKLLNCDPMRISKKYTGDQCIGKIIFRRREDEVSKEDMELIRRDLAELEKTYLEREQYNQRRREKRLESELSRDKSRYIAARTLGGYSAPQDTSAGAAAAGRAQGAVATTAATASATTHYQQTQMAAVSAPMAMQQTQQLHHAPHHPHHAPFPPTRGPMPLQHHQASAGAIHPPRYPLHAQQQQQTSHVFNSSASAGDSSATPHSSAATTTSTASTSTSSSSASSSSSLDPSGALSRSSTHDSSAAFLGAPHAMSAQSQLEPPATESFPRVSSIDSFSCLFPRVASIDNFQLPHQGASGAGLHAASGFGTAASTFGDSLQHTYDPHTGALVKSLSIGDGLNAYFPRVQSLEQLSTLLEAHAPPSPRASKSETKAMKQETDVAAPDSASAALDRKRLVDASSAVKDEPRPDADAELQRRLSPSASASSSARPTDAANQLQIPKPLSKMPRSSSGIFPRIPSMDKLPRIPSMDKLATLSASATAERIPRVPSIDKLSRIPSHSDMLSRFGSSDHLSSFPSFSNLTSLSTCASFTNLSALSSSGTAAFKSGFPRNSSIEDILSLVASSESSGGMGSAGSHLQLSALAAVAGEESSQIAAAADRKRRLEAQAQELESKKSKVST